MIKTVAVLGQGSMGSSITQHAAACGYKVILWGRNEEKVAAAVAKIGAERKAAVPLTKGSA